MKLRGVCCAEPEKNEVVFKQNNRSYLIVLLTLNIEGKPKSKELYQCVVKTNVSFQTGVSVVELHNWHFCCCDGQNIPHTWWNKRAPTASYAVLNLTRYIIAEQNIIKILRLTLITLKLKILLLAKEWHGVKCAALPPVFVLRISGQRMHNTPVNYGD